VKWMLIAAAIEKYDRATGMSCQCQCQSNIFSFHLFLDGSKLAVRNLYLDSVLSVSVQQQQNSLR